MVSLFSKKLTNQLIDVAASGLSCITWGLGCVVRDLSLQHVEPLVVTHGLSSCTEASGVLVP